MSWEMFSKKMIEVSMAAYEGKKEGRPMKGFDLLEDLILKYEFTRAQIKQLFCAARSFMEE